jgi:hypothetical protein
MRFCILGLVIATILQPIFLQGMDEEDPALPGFLLKPRRSLEYDFSQAVSRCDMSEVERLWDTWAALMKTWPHCQYKKSEQELETAVLTCGPESIPVVAFLLQKGVDVNYIDPQSKKCLFQKELEHGEGSRRFDEKKAKILLLMDAGAKIDFNMVKKFAAEKIEELEQSDLPQELKEDVIQLEQWRELEQIIDGSRWRAELPALFQEFVPVTQLAFLIGPYAHPYFDAQDSLEQESAEGDGQNGRQPDLAVGSPTWPWRRSEGEDRGEPQQKKLKLEHV